MPEGSAGWDSIISQNTTFGMSMNNNTNLTESFSLPDYVQAIMIIMYAVISIAAIGGNIIVCYIVFSYQRMRTVTNYFIMNLAVADIMMAMICIPFTFVASLLLNYWPFGSIMCPVVTYAQAVSVFLSAYTLVAISIDRYMAIINPLKPRMTKVQAKITIVLVWIVSLLTPLPIAILSQVLDPQSQRPQCTEKWDDQKQRYAFSMALMTLQYFFPLSVLIFTYMRIAICVWGKKAPGEAENSRDQRLAASKRKMTKMMIIVVILYILCWLPLNVFNVAADKFPDMLDYDYMVYVLFACHWSAMSHACCNPFIYCWMNSTYRHGFHLIFRFLPILDNKELDKHSVLQRSNTLTTSIRSNSYSESTRRLSATFKEADQEIRHVEHTSIKIKLKNNEVHRYSKKDSLTSAEHMSYV